ncbi:MAG: hypothetical protein JOZ73_12110 [Solirubrobacterales bacterium]|nr:hypothetical protein [Solirubrobacterales bacterium]
MSNSSHVTSLPPQDANRQSAPASAPPLYVSHCGLKFAAWLGGGDRRGKNLRAPDFWFDEAHGTTGEIVALLAEAKLLPQVYAVREVSPELAREGVRLGMAAKRRKPTLPKLDPEKGGLFAAEHVRPCDPHPGDVELEKLAARYTVVKREATPDPMQAADASLRGGSSK